MSQDSGEGIPKIYSDISMTRYGSFLDELGCEHMSIPLFTKGAHFLIPPDIAVYRWDPNGDAKLIYEEIQRFRANFPHRIIILEGLPDADHAQVYCGLQMKIWLEGKDAMQPSQGVEQTCMILKSIAVRAQIKDQPPALSRPKPKEDLYARHLNLLEGLIGTGDQKAGLLLEHFGSALEVIHAINNYPKLIYLIKGFGPEFISTNISLLRGSKKI